jgi:hypothetical protein
MLNVPLYEALCERGEVCVVNEDSEGELIITSENGSLRATQCRGGEEYKLNCPVCGDTRKRLYVSHWVFKPVVQKGKRVYTDGLFYCHNEKCNLSDYRRDLSTKVKMGDSVVVVRKSRRKKVEGEFPLPEGCLPVNSHDAPVAIRKYLEGRAFDLDELYEKWNVMYCESIPGYTESGPKIVYPITLFGKNIGWQARLCWDPCKEDQRAGVRKYYFAPGLSKSEILYNRDQARNQEITVIVEGVTDVHRLGACAVAIFGKVPSLRQTQIFRNVFGYNLGVMLLDSDADKEAEEYVARYAQGIFSQGLISVRMPEGDPASHSAEYLWDLILAEAVRKCTNGKENQSCGS